MEIWLPIKLVEILLPILAHQHKHQHKPLFLKDSIYSYFIEVVDPIQLLLSQIPTLAPTIQTSLKIIIKLSQHVNLLLKILICINNSLDKLMAVELGNTTMALARMSARSATPSILQPMSATLAEISKGVVNGKCVPKSTTQGSNSVLL